MKKKIINIMLIAIMVIGLTGCGSDVSDNSNSNNNTDNSANNSKTEEKNKYGLGDTFIFDNLELTFYSKYSFTTIKNKYSEHNGKSVIKLGVKVKNIASEKNSLNMFYYSLFGSQGTELDGVTSYFDDTIDFAGDLKPNASYKTYFYILYDGDGKYSIDFDNFSQEVSIEFDVKK